MIRLIKNRRTRVWVIVFIATRSINRILQHF